MKNIKALFVDCDGVLYDKNKLSYHDMAVAAFNKTIASHGITEKQVETRHKEQNQKGIHGLFNVALSLCQERDIPFQQFAYKMVQNTAYDHIPQDHEMLQLLKKASKKLPVYIVTDNTWIHLLRVVSCLNGKMMKDIFSPLNVTPITIENTLYDNVFHPKKVGNQFLHLCAQINQMPSDVLLLDDTPAACEAAQKQGLQVIPITGPEQTKKILKGIVDEKSKRSVSIRKTCGRTSR